MQATHGGNNCYMDRSGWAVGHMLLAASDMQFGNIESRMEYIETTEQTSCSTIHIVWRSIL